MTDPKKAFTENPYSEADIDIVDGHKEGDVTRPAPRHPDAALKVDVDPAWPDDAWQGLAATGRVLTASSAAMLDCTGSAAPAFRVAR